MEEKKTINYFDLTIRIEDYKKYNILQKTW